MHFCIKATVTTNAWSVPADTPRRHAGGVRPLLGDDQGTVTLTGTVVALVLPALSSARTA
jgi:hypothetical protein